MVAWWLLTAMTGEGRKEKNERKAVQIGGGHRLKAPLGMARKGVGLGPQQRLREGERASMQTVVSYG
jgi:hypothetical protein